jgi:CBS domain containing-hemolysin-like protein
MITALLILLNGLFVAAEFAIIGAPRASIESLAAQGNKAARMVRRMLHDPRRQDRYLATAQIGITFASLGLGMYGEHMLADWLAHELEILGASRWIAAHTVASVLAITVLTYFHIVLGEMVPKSLALQHAESTALKVTPVMLVIKAVLFPLVVLLNGIGNGILRVVGIRRQMTASYYHTPEELRYIVEESAEGGLLVGSAGTVLRELFDFAELDAGEVMVPRVHAVGIPLDADSKQIKDIVRESRHTRYPVFEEDMDHVVGMLHVKDILRLLVEGPARIKDVLQPVPFVPETSHLDTVLEIMRKERSQMVVVMDEHGGTAGLITIEDVFEEVVGPVCEEYGEATGVCRDEGGKLRAAGTVRLDEVGEYFGVELGHEEVDTVSGLVLALLDRPPRVGDAVEYRCFRLLVVSVEGHGVAECTITYEPQAQDLP